MQESEKPRRFSGNIFADLLAICFIAFVLLSLYRAVAPPRQDDPNKPCYDTQHQIFEGVTTYLSDWDERFPPMQTPQVFSRAMRTYLDGTARYITCPLTQRYYRPNTSLSGGLLASVNPAHDTVTLLSDAVPHADGKSTILYLDGHIEHGGKDIADPTTECINRTQRLVDVLKMYAQDYDERLPPLNDPVATKTLLFPYAKSQRLFYCPETRLDYTFNASIGSQSLASFPDTEIVEAVRDTQPHPDHKSTVAFLDGHVERGGKPIYMPNVNAVCVSRMRQVLRGLQMYIQDYDETLPTANPSFQDQVYPYVRSHSAFHCPSTGELFAFNPSLRGVTLASIANPRTTVALQDPKPHVDGLKTVGFLDGHVERGGIVQPLDPLNPITADDDALRRAKRVALGVLLYVQDYDEKFPPMTNYQEFTSALLPYTRDESLFHVPPTNEPWVLNQNLSHISLAAIPSPATTVEFRAPRPGRGGLMVKAYADGHVKRTIP